jgi:hypothetical protein
MVKTSPSDVWHKPIKEIGNGYITLICKTVDQNEAVYAGNGMEVGDDGALTQFTTDQPDFPPNITVEEDIADGDTYFLGRKKGAKILHNQKLASTYSIGDALYKSAAGTWTYADKDTAQSLLMEVGILCGPADRITSGVIKDIDDAFTATEPVDICQ